jgi:oligoendopeptidase F
MNLLPFGTLPPYRPRRFVPESVNWNNWSAIQSLFDRLETAAKRCTSTDDLERWLLDWSEVNAALDEESARRYIAMTCHTDDPEAEKAHLHFVEQIEPQTKPRQFALQQMYVRNPLRGELLKIGAPISESTSSTSRQAPKPDGSSALPRYTVFDRDTVNYVELFRPENVPLETEEAKLGQQYQKLTGSLAVNFRGEEKTLVQMGRFLEEPDRATREEAWKLVAERRLKEASTFDQQFDELAKLRGQIATHAGFNNYRDYAFRRLGRFDYTPADCERFHEAVEKEVTPLLRELQAERKNRLGVSTLRPWDLSVDPLNRPPLKPFEHVDDMVSRSQHIFDRLDPELAGGFRQMQELSLLDLANRKGKAPGGYQFTLPEARLPFIFMNAVGLQRDVETILHEAGHAFHALATRHEDLYAYRGAPIEFCEVASMSMELLGNEFIEEFYQPADAARARRTHLEGIVGVLAWIATVDAFQHWLYTHPGHSLADRDVAWRLIHQRFNGDVDWNGLETERAKLWHRQLHIFLHPFYYIEYGIAQLGALQVWVNSRIDKPAALSSYKRALALGNSRPLPELFAAAGCKFEFSEATIRPLTNMIRGQLQAMG